MNDKEIYQGVANSFTEKKKFSITVPVSWRPDAPPPPPPVKRSLFERLFKPAPIQLHTPVPPSEETFTIYPCKLANMARIAGASVTLPDAIKDGGLAEVVLPLIPGHLPTIIYIVAAGIQNNHEEPSQELITFIERNFDGEDLYACLYPVLEQVQMQSFLNSIVLAKGTVSILKEKTSPTDGSE